jgi:putative flavoprotein involved in K+ transport
VLGKWDAEAPSAGTQHVTIAVSGADGGKTIDFRRLADAGITLLGMTESYDADRLTFAGDLAANLARGDASYLSFLDEADAYAARNGLDFPEEPQARLIGPDPACVTNPIGELDIAAADIGSIIWATGYSVDYSWLDLDLFGADGKPKQKRGVSVEPGIFFLGLPWQTRRGSSFIWGVWHDAKYLADRIATQRKYLSYERPAKSKKQAA